MAKKVLVKELVSVAVEVYVLVTIRSAAVAVAAVAFKTLTVPLCNVSFLTW